MNEKPQFSLFVCAAENRQSLQKYTFVASVLSVEKTNNLDLGAFFMICSMKQNVKSSDNYKMQSTFKAFMNALRYMFTF